MRRILASAALALLLAACATTPPAPDAGQAPRAAADTADTATAGDATPGAAPALSPSLPREAVLAIDFARNIGTFVHRHERAAERTLAHLSANGIAAPADALGWVTEQVDGRGAVQVTYVAGPASDETRWRAWARLVALPAQPGTAGDVEPRSAADGTLTEFERDKLRARRTAERIDATDCATPARVVVVSWRRQGRDIFLAYRLAAETTTGDAAGAPMPWGGQHEFTLDARGRDLLAHRRSDAACSALVPVGAVLEGRTASRDVPSVFDVYTALRSGRTLLLETLGNGMRWRIDGDRVRALCDAACRALQPQARTP
jgi:hypothetical protein